MLINIGGSLIGIIEIGLPFINLDTAADQPGAVGRALPAYRVRLVEVGLGPTILRVETAAVVGSALILNRVIFGETP